MSGRSCQSESSESDENSSENRSVYPQPKGRLRAPSYFPQPAQAETKCYDSPYMPGLCSSASTEDKYTFYDRNTEIVEIKEEDIFGEMETMVNIPVDEAISYSDHRLRLNIQQNENNSQESIKNDDLPRSQDYFADVSEDEDQMDDLDDYNFYLNLGRPLTPLPPDFSAETSTCKNSHSLASDTSPISQKSKDYVSARSSDSPSPSICSNNESSDSNMSAIISAVLLPKFTASSDSGISSSFCYSEIHSDSQNENSSIASSGNSDVSQIRSAVLLPDTTSFSSIFNVSKKISDVRSFGSSPPEQQISVPLPLKVLTNTKNNSVSSYRNMPHLGSTEFQQSEETEDRFYSPAPQISANISEMNENHSETGGVDREIPQNESTSEISSAAENSSQTSSVKSDSSETRSPVKIPFKAKNEKVSYCSNEPQKRKLPLYDEPTTKRRKGLKSPHNYISALSRAIHSTLETKLIDWETKLGIIYSLLAGISQVHSRDTFADTTTDTE